MAIRDLDRRFSSSMSEFYDRYMVPLIFEPYARDLAIRMAAKAPQRLLEIAGGTGVVTRALADKPKQGSLAILIHRARNVLSGWLNSVSRSSLCYKQRLTFHILIWAHKTRIFVTCSTLWEYP